MTINRIRLILTLVFVLTQGSEFSVMGQALNTCDEVKASKNFLALADRRGELIAESQQLRTDISELEKQLPNAIEQAELDKLRQQLDDLEKKITGRTPLDDQTMENLRNKIKQAKTQTMITDELNKKRELLDHHKGLISCIQETIPQLTSPDQAFRGYMSAAFAGLIGAVIIGFFVLAFIDETMRRAIFSGETGIQFLTLFSLVIAIILFGITSILHDKELAALLGGLSGYILGRTGQRGGASGSQPGSPGEIAAFQKFINDLKSINIIPPSVNLSAAFKAQQLVAEPKDINGALIKDVKGFALTWESSDPNVATVDQSGLVSKAGTGTAQITATFANIKSNPCVVTCT
jgi:uncharacterized protein YjdB